MVYTMNLSAYLRRIYKCCYLDGYVMRYAQIVYRTKLRPLVAIYVYVICSLDSKNCAYISTSIIIKEDWFIIGCSFNHIGDRPTLKCSYTSSIVHVCFLCISLIRQVLPNSMNHCYMYLYLNITLIAVIVRK